MTFTPHKNVGGINEILARASIRSPPVLHEFEAYDLFTLLGINVPQYKYIELDKLQELD